MIQIQGATTPSRVHYANYLHRLSGGPHAVTLPSGWINTARQDQLANLVIERTNQIIVDRDFAIQALQRRILYQIAPAAIAITIAATLANVAMFFFFNQAPVDSSLPAGNEDCTKTKEQLENCKKVLPRWRDRINECMTDWKANLKELDDYKKELNDYKNSTNQTIKNLTSQLEACEDAIKKTVN